FQQPASDACPPSVARQPCDVWHSGFRSAGNIEVQPVRIRVSGNRRYVEALSENRLMAFQFVAVGTSLGGFNALKTVLGALPKDFPLPVAIVQHRSHEDSEALAPLLACHTQLPVIEVDDKEEIKEGRVYVSPSNYHLMVDSGHFALSADPPVLHAR